MVQVYTGFQNNILLKCWSVFSETLKCFTKRQEISDNLQQKQQDKQGLTNRYVLNNQKDCKKRRLILSF